MKFYGKRSGGREMGRVNRGQVIYSIFLAVLLGVFISSSLGLAQDDRDKKDLRPERGIAVYTEYSERNRSQGRIRQDGSHPGEQGTDR